MLPNFKSPSHEEITEKTKKILTKSRSFKEKDQKKMINNSFKTPEKEKKNLVFQSKTDYLLIKSESNILDEKNAIWEKEREEEELMNELKEESEESGEDSDLSYDSEEIDDEALRNDAQMKAKSGIEILPLNLKNQNEKKTIIVQNDKIDLKLNKTKAKSNEFDIVTRSVNYPPFIREKKLFI